MQLAKSLQRLGAALLLSQRLHFLVGGNRHHDDTGFAVALDDHFLALIRDIGDQGTPSLLGIV